jgi:uncharacterized membrane protein
MPGKVLGAGQVININSSTFIYRPIKQVFDFVTTPENDFQWQYGTLASAQITEGLAKVGTAFQSIGHLLGHRIQGTYEVTEYEPNKKYEFKSLSGPLQSFTSYTFNIAKGSTKVDMSLRANAVNLIDLNENIIEKKMKKQIKENLTMLKNILESE